MTTATEVPVKAGDRLMVRYGERGGQVGEVLRIGRHTLFGVETDIVIMQFDDGRRLGFTAGELEDVPSGHKDAPAPTYYALIPWAQANHISPNTVYEFCRRRNNPIPHIKIGRKYLIEHAAAMEWLKKNLGPQDRRR